SMRCCTMKLSRMLLALALVGLLASVAYVRQANESSGTKMAHAAEKLLSSFTPQQKDKAVFGFDDAERFNWHFVPLQDAMKKSTRKGLPLEDMTDEQRKAALELVKAGTSQRGYTAATTIMSLESILHELERGGSMVRDPDWYFFTIFGTPSNTGKWGWRVEGQHLSINITMDGPTIVATTPYFFGANPAEVKAGDKKGLRILALEEDLAKELFNSLTDEQK